MGPAEGRLWGMVNISIEYVGDLHCQAVHGPSGRSLETDAPVDNQGRGESFSPTDLVATAMGTCMATVMGIAARRDGLQLEGMRIEVQKEMSTDTPRRIVKLTTHIWMPVPKSADIKGVMERTAMTCPVHRSLSAEMEKPVVFHWKDDSAA